MSTANSEFVTVDMRGLKQSLVAIAKAKRSTVSSVVREAVKRELGISGPDLVPTEPRSVGRASDAWVKLSVRFTRDEVSRLSVGARAAGLSRGAYLAGLVDGVEVLSMGSRPDHIAALVASCAGLSTLSRNTHQLTMLLRQGNVQRALQYRDLLDTLVADVRNHLRLAVQALAELQRPRTPASEAAAQRPNRRVS